MIALVFLLTLSIGNDVTVRDPYGLPLGQIDSPGANAPVGSKTFVMDKYGKTLGYTNPQGTFDVYGKKLADQPLPGLLLPVPQER